MGTQQTMTPAEYCREIETYLCRRNEGHLIRIAGPSFEQVCGWAKQGVPLKVALRGIDRFCERYYAKGPRRRPVRIEFCEADVLDAFDEWRRAVGVTASAGPDTAPAPSRKPALAAHVERVVNRLTALRGGRAHSPAFDEWLSEAVRRLDGLAAAARQARGETRARLIAQLDSMDRDLVSLALKELDAGMTASLRKEADAELAPFGARMAATERQRASEAAFERLARESLGLPTVRYE